MMDAKERERLWNRGGGLQDVRDLLAALDETEMARDGYWRIAERAERERLAAEERAAALDAALSALVKVYSVPADQDGRCWFCGGYPAGDAVMHTSDCPWEQARAALSVTEPREEA